VWSEQHFIPLIDHLPYRECIITLDNAAYHKIRKGQISGKTISSYKREELVDWLQSEGIDFPLNAKKNVLLDIVKDKIPVWAEWYAKMKGNHTILWQPANNSRLNPIEELWMIIKNYVRENYTNGTTLSDVEERIDFAYDTLCTTKRIAQIFKHSIQALKEEQNLYEASIENNMEPVDSEDSEHMETEFSESETE